MSTTTITIERAQVATFIASKLAALAVPSPGVRADIGPVQVDKVLLVEHFDEHPAIRFRFEMAGGFGAEVSVKLAEFGASPSAYMRDLLENLQGIRHAAHQRRAGRMAEVSAVYSQMGGAHG
jgi:hypothetical protein